MIELKTAPYAALLLRLVNGLLFVTHGLTKLLVFTPAGTMKFFASIGLPGWLGVVTMVIEILGGVALILGAKVREVSVVLALVLFGATFSVHIHNGFSFANPNGGWEYPMMWAFVMIALAGVGEGAFALLPSKHRR